MTRICIFGGYPLLQKLLASSHLRLCSLTSPCWPRDAQTISFQTCEDIFIYGFDRPNYIFYTPAIILHYGHYGSV